MAETPEIPNLDGVQKGRISSRYGEHRVEIPVEIAEAEIERNFPDLKIKEIKSLDKGEGMNNIGFLVNGNLIFRFSKQEKADETVEKEIKVLPEIQKRINIEIPNFEYKGKQDNGLNIVGYRMIKGESLDKKYVVNENGEINQEITRQIAEFLRQIHAINVADGKQWGIKVGDIHYYYENILNEAREYVYCLIEEMYPGDAQKIKDYIEKIFAGYLNDENNFAYTLTVIHGDVGPEHIIFDNRTRKIAGVIDWGGIRIGDPDYDLFRMYRDYGEGFIKEFLNYYPHGNTEQLMKKLDFFFRAQMVRYVVRMASVGDEENAKWNLARLRKQALGLGYWMEELKDEEPDTL